MVRLVPLLLLLTACSESGPDSAVFDGLQDDADFTSVDPNGSIRLPDDHGAHPDYRSEWWYLTANLTDNDGNDYGLQWTLFRFASGEDPGVWSDGQFYMAHAVVNSKDQKWFQQKFARGGVGNAGVNSSPFNAYIDHWQWQSPDNNLIPASLKFDIEDQIQLEVALTPSGPAVFHGDNGYSLKAPDSDIASWYYSLPAIDVQAHAVINEEAIELTGQGWFDHEWSSQYMSEDYQGWDWFSLHLDNGDRLMLFRMRQNDATDKWFGSWIPQDQEVQTLQPEQIQTRILATRKVPTSAHAQEPEQKNLPLEWNIQIPSVGVDLNVHVIKDDQWVPASYPYYEAMVNIDGSHRGKGFMELTGY